MDDFDADVLIYAAVPNHPLGQRVPALFPPEPTVETGAVAGIGSVLLIPELLTKPMRDHGLRAADAVHLATAVAVGADRFITNNSGDFSTSITEIEVIHPSRLPEP